MKAHNNRITDWSLWYNNNKPTSGAATLEIMSWRIAMRKRWLSAQSVRQARFCLEVTFLLVFAETHTLLSL